MNSFHDSTILAHREIEDEQALVLAFDELRDAIDNVNPDTVTAAIVVIVGRDGEAIMDGYDHDSLLGILGSEDNVRAGWNALHEHMGHTFSGLLSDAEAFPAAPGESSLAHGKDMIGLLELITELEGVKADLAADPLNPEHNRRMVELFDGAKAKLPNVPASIENRIETIRASLARHHGADRS